MIDYKPFLISNFRTGFNEAVEPWIAPGDAFQLMLNAHLYRGVLEKIKGYDVYARMSYRRIEALSGTIDGANKTFTGTLTSPVTTNNIIVQSSISTTGVSSETFTYFSDGAGSVVNLKSDLGGTGTLDFLSGAISVTFNTAPAQMPGAGNIYNAVFISYDYAANPSVGFSDIMGIKPYYAQNGDQSIMIFNTRRMGLVNVLEGSIATQYQSDNGISEVPHEVHVQNAAPAPAFNGAILTFTGTVSAPVVPRTISFTIFNNTPALINTITDNGSGRLSGTNVDSTLSFINYVTGAWTITFTVAPAATDTLNTSIGQYGDVWSGNYTNFFSVCNYFYNSFITNGVDNIRYFNGTELLYLNTNLTLKPGTLTYDITTCLHVAINRERLLLLLPTIGSPLQNAIYWSSAGNPLDFTNAEFLLAPTSESIRTFAFINSDMVVPFGNTTRVFRYTGDAFSPFRWDTINSVWRCDARYTAINYDSYFTYVGKPAIVASDAVNVKKYDEIIPDFTLNDRALLEGPVISIQQTSIGQCYGERFDDFKEGWMCFKKYDAADEDNVIDRSDSVLAFNYVDDTYAVYDFPFSCLGFGRVISQDVWGNNFDLWGDADYAWETFYESFNALVDLAGDRNGVVYTLGNSATAFDEDGNSKPVLFDVISKNFNPFIEQGELCRFGYLDLFVSANATTKLRMQIYRDDTMYVDSNGQPNGYYQETVLDFTPTDSMSTEAQFKIWKRVYIGAVAKAHTIRLYQDADDFTSDTQDQPVRVHGMVLYMKPAGRIFN